MDIYIVDANIIFSAVLNLDSGIGQFILRSRENKISFFAPKYLKTEIDRHFNRIVQRSGLTQEDIRLSINKIYEYITVVSDEIIPFEEYVKAMRLVRNIDPNDVTFVALTNYLEKILWTGDMKLYNGLKKLGYKRVVSFDDIKKIYKV